VIPSPSARISQRTGAALLVDDRSGWGAPTTATFRTVTELQAARDDDELETRLGELDRQRLEDLARQGYLDGHEQGSRNGYKEGYETGFEQAMAEVVARFAPALDALHDAGRRLAAADAITLAELDERATALALDVAEAVIGHELAAAADPGAAAIARALAFVPDRGDIAVRLHPDDVAALGQIGDLAPGREMTITADAGVPPGSCVVDVGACRIDAQIDSALDRVRTVLGQPGGGR
jgi:flagellar assembly protein FliH